MDLAIVAGTTLLGLAGTAHCTAMCGAACTAVAGDSPGRFAAWQAGRAVGYAGAGALAAGAIQTMGAWSAGAVALKPAWTLLHAAALSLGLWMLIAGQLPGFLRALGRVAAAPAGGMVAVAVPRPGFASLGRPVAIGMGWVVLPCGMLHSALMTAALASSPVAGAIGMAAFAAASGIGLWAGPMLWRRLASTGATPQRAIRLAGACMAIASASVLGGGLIHRVAAWCGL